MDSSGAAPWADRDRHLLRLSISRYGSCERPRSCSGFFPPHSAWCVQGPFDAAGHAVEAGLVGFARSPKPRGPVELRQVEAVCSLLCKLLEALKLRPAVALAEGMHLIHIADDGPRRVGKVLRGEAFQEVGFDEAAVHVTHARLDVLTELELVPVPGNLDGAELSRPVVDILKKVPVNGPEMIEVEVSPWYAVLDTLRDQTPLGPVQSRQVPDLQLVTKDVCSRIEIRVFRHSTAGTD